MDWGNIPVWVGVFVAAISLAVAARTYIVNSRRQLRDQANNVTVTMRELPPSAPGHYVHEAEVTNFSDGPIWRVRVHISRYTTSESSPVIDLLEPGHAVTFATEPFWWAVYGVVDPKRSNYPDPSVYVDFVDADGYKWRRKGTEPITPQPAHFAAKQNLAYRIRKRVMPTRLRHAVRDTWRAWHNSRPRRVHKSDENRPK